MNVILFIKGTFFYIKTFLNIIIIDKYSIYIECYSVVNILYIKYWLGLAKSQVFYSDRLITSMVFPFSTCNYSSEIASGVPHSQLIGSQLPSTATNLAGSSIHWCALTAIWVPRGLVRTSTSPGWAPSGIIIFSGRHTLLATPPLRECSPIFCIIFSCEMQH